MAIQGIQRSRADRPAKRIEGNPAGKRAPAIGKSIFKRVSVGVLLRNIAGVATMILKVHMEFKPGGPCTAPVIGETFSP
jgi:hypothetical protein